MTQSLFFFTDRIMIVLFFFVLLNTASAQEKKIPKPVKELPKERVIYKVDEADGELPPPPPPAPVKIGEDEKDAILQFYQQIDANIEQKLKQLKAVDPVHYEQKVQSMYREYVFLNRLKEEEKDRYNEAIELRKLSVRADEKARKYRQNKSETEKQQIREELRGIVDKLFDLREKERAAEARRIEARLARLQQEMKERRQNKSKIVENRLNEMIGKGHLYEW